MTNANPLLRTKYAIPRRRSDHVERSRLTSRLIEGRRRNHCLVLVSAPPGYGKTALLSEWIGLEDLPAAWLSLDAEDNDPAVFWAHVAGALRLAYPQFTTSVFSYLNAPARPKSKAVVTLLLNDLAHLHECMMLVLDDFHHITDADVTAGLELLLNHCPPSFLLVIGTRADPALLIARLRFPEVSRVSTTTESNSVAAMGDPAVHDFRQNEILRWEIARVKMSSTRSE